MPLCRRSLGIILDSSESTRRPGFAQPLGYRDLLSCMHTLSGSNCYFTVETCHCWWASIAYYSDVIRRCIVFVYDSYRPYRRCARDIVVLSNTHMGHSLSPHFFRGGHNPPTYCCHGRSASERHMNRPMSGLRYSKQRHLPE